MPEQSGNRTETVPREQLETALQFMEWAHGDALRQPWSEVAQGEAHAYYEAITMLEDALDENLRPPDEALHSDYEQELIQQSREARDEGYEAATLFEERFGTDRTPYSESRIATFIQSLLCKVGIHSGGMRTAEEIDEEIDGLSAFVCSHCGAVHDDSTPVQELMDDA